MHRFLQRYSPGQSLPLVGLMAVMLFLMTGLAIDGGLLYAQHRLMQNTADASCLAASSQLSLGKTEDEAKARAKDVIGTNLGSTGPGTGVNAPGTLAYTAIGDVVNVAKRLQERAEPGQILAEDSIIRCLGDLVVADKLGEIQVKGRQVPAVVYNLRSLA